MYQFDLEETINNKMFDKLYSDTFSEEDEAILNWLIELRDLKFSQDLPLTVVGSNPKELYGYNDKEKWEDLKNLFKKEIISQKSRCVISNMSLGPEMQLAKAATELREEGYDIKLSVILPCRNYEVKRIEEDKEEYRKIVCLADSVEYLYEEYQKGCIHEANKKAIDKADIVLFAFKNMDKRYREYFDYSHTKKIIPIIKGEVSE